jgi:hypothetical protein
MVFIEDEEKLKKHIKTKLSYYKKSSKNSASGKSIITTAEALDIIRNLESGICPGCNCEMLFTDYAPWCLYQFSFRKINDLLIHSADNIKILCYNCAALGEGLTKATCTKKCHYGSQTDEELVQIRNIRIMGNVLINLANRLKHKNETNHESL